MKIVLFALLVVVIAVLTGCNNTNNYYTDPQDPRNNQRCNCEQLSMGTAGQPATLELANTPAPMTMPIATQIVTAYEEVYATEYTPNGPVVKKQLVPVMSTVPLVEQPVLGNVPNGYGYENRISVNSAPYIKPVPVVIGTPPAQPVVPAVSQPVAWFGPTAAPNYSTQTNWF